jgi:predicted heme/steroid binding protein/uncharacterized membrane protein
MQEFTPEELAHFDGKDGKPIYIAYRGKVYDVSQSKMWRGGQHMKRHPAGRDLTSDIQAAPHQEEVFERYPQVGTLAEAETPAPERPMPKFITYFLDANPFFRRHPHPMTVHFPIVFLLSNPVFNMLYLITGVKSLETTAVHCLAAGILFTLVAIATGFITWWYNYMGRMMTPVAIKIPLSLLALMIGIVMVVWRLVDPGIMDNLQGANRIYMILSLALFPITSVIGWFGATMTFPIEKE